MSVYSKKRSDGTTAWYYDFMYNKKRYRGVGGATKTQATRTLDKVRSQVIAGEFNHPKEIENPLFQNYAELYLKRRNHLRSHKRNVVLVKHLTKFFSGKVLSAIVPTMIEDYISYRRECSISNSTINRELACMKRMYNLAIKWKCAKTNPVLDVDFLEEPPGRTRYLSHEEITRLLNSCYDYFRPIVLLAMNTGMRLEEVISLKWKHVHIKNVMDPYIEVVKPKNNKKRNVPLNDSTIELLANLKRKHNVYVFVGRYGKPLKSVRKPFASAIRIACIDDFKFHDFRHTFASYFIMNGGDLLTLKEILGHSSLKMVERYAHLATSHKRRQINLLNDVFSNCHLSVNSLKI